MKKFNIILLFLISIQKIISDTSYIELDINKNYKVIENIIKNPDTLIFYKLLHRSNLKDGYENVKKLSMRIIEILKNEFNGDYRYIYSELYQYIPDKTHSLYQNIEILKRHDFIVQINSLKTGRRITFTFLNYGDGWTLYDANLLYPGESPDAFVNRFKDKGVFTDLIYVDNCKVFVNDNYRQISELLQNPDSLKQLLSKVLPDETFNNLYKSSSFTFYQFVEKFNNKYLINVDEIFEASSSFKKDGITILNKIIIVNKDLNDNNSVLGFYFMKKNGVWQFYDRRLNNYPNFP